MDRKGVSTVTVTTADVKASLHKVRTLSSEEEKVVRMRHGGAADPKAPLPRAAAGNEELEDQLYLIEMQLMRAWKARLSQSKGNQLAAARVESSPTKNKIVRALRKKRN